MGSFIYNFVRFNFAYLNGYVHDAMTLGITSGGGKSTAIGIGMWLGLIMAFNVWFVIWPNQKKALGIVEVDPETKAKSAKTAMLFSRTNTLLIITNVAYQWLQHKIYISYFFFIFFNNSVVINI